jgi:hypothetical protein
VKSFRWDRDKLIETPLSEGIVTPDVVNQIVGERTALPVCLQVEYVKHEAVPFDSRSSIVGNFRSDAQLLRQWLGLV